ncbi:uncharacterized protein LOC106179996 isoform X2 [Lingula anatina]|uniref:Uncharacterized protein LOC106179996 isoform X2 n=1 Tax=Lingula anatina TaxID=7574 RepID=A0A1S3K9I6_LINAN|nr:uncharacterized protein LOC106179996 isoform X2 [Lingula anatina]|eukprot:XP_013419293.1 uncharacterized protein LOC106179996 isoform X2 [Lingula anatina]
MGAHHSGNHHRHHVDKSGLKSEKQSSEKHFSQEDKLLESLFKLLVSQDPEAHQKLEIESKQDNASIKEGLVSRAVFEKAFNGPLQTLGKLLFSTIQQAEKSRHDAPEHISEQQFKKVCKEILQLFSEEQHMKYYFKLFSKGRDTLAKEDGRQMVEVSYTLALAAAHLPYHKCEDDDPVLEALVKSMFGSRDSMTYEQFCVWSNRHCPHIFSGVHSWLMDILTRHPSGFHKHETPPSDLNEMLAKHGLLTLSTLWALSCVLPQCYLSKHANIMDLQMSPVALMNKLVHVTKIQNWTELYNSSEHGLSFNRFQNHVFSYKGPTITLLSFEGKNVYCIAADEEWKESDQRWGGSDCMVLQVLPHFNMLQGGEKMMFVNSSTRGLPYGIQVGQNHKSLVLEICDGLSKVKNYGREAATVRIEVWGCAGIAMKQAQLKQRAWEKKEAEKLSQRKLNLESWAETPDRQLLELVGVRTKYSENFVRPEDSD